MLNENLEYNALLRENLLGRQKIISEIKNASWGDQNYIFIGKNSLGVSRPSKFIDVSGANQLKLIIKSNLSKTIKVFAIRTIHPQTKENLSVVLLEEYLPEDVLTVQPGGSFELSTQHFEGLTDVNIFNGLLGECYLDIRTTDSSDATGTIDLLMMGRR